MRIRRWVLDAAIGSGSTESFGTSEIVDSGVSSGSVVPTGSVLNRVCQFEADVYEQRELDFPGDTYQER